MLLSEIVARNLQTIRRKKKLSQEALAEEAGISVSYVSMLECGQRSPSLGTLEVLAEALHVSAASLLER